MWWQNPLNVCIAVSVLVVMLIGGLWVLYRRVYRRRTPRSLRDSIVLRLNGLQQLSLDHDHERLSIYLELVQMMREYAQHTFGILHEGMTDVEFLKALDAHKIHDSAERFVQLVELMSDEASFAKFAAQPPSYVLVNEHIALLLSYFQAVGQGSA